MAIKGCNRPLRNNFLQIKKMILDRHTLYKILKGAHVSFFILDVSTFKTFIYDRSKARTNLKLSKTWLIAVRANVSYIRQDVYYDLF